MKNKISRKEKADLPKGINLDIDGVLNEIKHARASMNVMLKSIEGLFGGDFGYYEASALIYQAESVFKSEADRFDRIITDLREGGAKDYNMNDPDKREVAP